MPPALSPVRDSTMRELFKGWRRKLGCATLVMACLFAVGWIRSFYCRDTAVIPLSNSTSVEFSSMRSKFCLLRLSEPRRLKWETSPVEGEDHTYNLLTADWSRRIAGARAFSNLHAFAASTAGIVVPYWLPTLPLTLLSAWLILRKPRPNEKMIP